jgi:hypothetical protein
LFLEEAIGYLDQELDLIDEEERVNRPKRRKTQAAKEENV